MNRSLDQHDCPADLSEEQRAEAAESEQLWQEAHRIVRDRPDVDVGDVYHVLRALRLSPSERLRRGLSRGRLRADLR